MSTKRTILLAAGLLLTAFLSNADPGNRALAQEPAARQRTLSEIYRNSGDVELQNKVAPFKVFDNLYHVGPGYVDAWLIPTSAGIIMIDTAEEPFVDHVIDNIRTLGFDLKDIKYILISHGHLDHFGGAARIQEASGARVGATEEDWQMIEQAGRTPGRGGGPSPRVPKRDMVIKEGDNLTLGATTLKFHHHPGHTPGVLSAEFTVNDNGTPHKAFWQGGGGSRGGLSGAQQAMETARRLGELQGVEVFVMIHSWLPYPNGGVFERAQLLAKRKHGDPNPFVDPASFAEYVQRNQANAARTLEEEKKKAGAAQ
jgi:metallo-beta-lactamase class B